MKALTLVCFACLAMRAAADNPPPVKFPVLAAHASAPRDFAPAGWIVESQAEGDLNGDQTSDVVLLLRDNEKRNILASAGPLNGTDTNPYILAIAFASPSGGYDLVLQNHTLISRPSFIAEWASTKIKRGSVLVAIDAAEGGLGEKIVTYTLRWGGNGWRAIGYDYFAIAHGSSLSVSANLLTGVVRSGGKTVRTLKTEFVSPPTLDAIGDGHSFVPPAVCALEAWLCTKR